MILPLTERFKPMKKTLILTFLTIVCVLYGCGNRKESTEQFEQVEQQNYQIDPDDEIARATFAPEDIYEVNMVVHLEYDESPQECINIKMYPDEQALSSFVVGDFCVVDYPLNEEQVKKVREMIAEYSMEVVTRGNGLYGYYPSNEKQPFFRYEILSYEVMGNGKGYRLGKRSEPLLMDTEGINMIKEILFEDCDEIMGRVYTNVYSEQMTAYFEEYAPMKFTQEFETLCMERKKEEIEKSPCSIAYYFYDSILNCQDCPRYVKNAAYRIQTNQETSDGVAEYNRYDYRTNAYEFELAGKSYMAACTKNVNTNEGVFLLLTLNSKNQILICYAMPILQGDSCSIYDDGMIIANYGDEWLSLGKEAFYIGEGDGLQSVDAVDPVLGEEIVHVDETFCEDYVPSEYWRGKLSDMEHIE